MRLACIQRAFAAAIVSPGSDRASGRFIRLLKAGGAPPPARALAVYRDNAAGAGAKALEAIHPVCAQILGARAFDRLAGEYSAGERREPADLNRYGEQFRGFLAARVGVEPALAGVDYLPDLARLEWLAHAVYYEADAPLFDGTAFAEAVRTRGAESLRLRPAAHVRLCSSPYPIHEIWSRHLAGNPPAQVALGAGDWLAIYRDGFRPAVESIPRARFELIGDLLAGWTIGELEAAGRELDSLAWLVERGWISSFD